jgi:hypothetical protein
MASWNIPALVNKISEDVPAIKGLLTALFKWTDADTTDVPVGAKRLQDVAGGKQMQEYSGSAWASVGKLMHDCDMLDGKHASTAQTADTIPVRDANGTIPGNISGNAATATSAYGLDSGYTVPVANGGTGATTAAGARASLGADNASNISSGILDIAYGGTGSSQKNFVDLTNNQNVAGVKTFSSSFTTSVSPMLTSTNWSGIGIGDTTRGQASYKMLAQAVDKDGKRFMGIETTAATDGTRTVSYTARKPDDSGWVTGFTFKILTDGTTQQFVQTPATNANDTQAASTAWVRTYCVTTMAFLQKPFPVNTRMVFQQSAAPTGWTKETGSGYNNIALRLTTGDIANKTNGKAFTTCMASGRGTANQTQGGTIANATQGGSLSKTTATGSIGNKTAGGSISDTTAGGTVGNKALSVAMLASHSHKAQIYNGDGSNVKYALFRQPNSKTIQYDCSTQATGSGSNHNHGFTGSSHGHTFTGTAHNHTFTGTEHTHTFTGSAHSHTFTGSAHNHTIDLDINYIDCIIAKQA